MQVYHDYFLLPGSRSTFPEVDPDPDPNLAKWHRSNQIQIQIRIQIQHIAVLSKAGR